MLVCGFINTSLKNEEYIELMNPANWNQDFSALCRVTQWFTNMSDFICLSREAASLSHREHFLFPSVQEV